MNMKMEGRMTAAARQRARLRDGEIDDIGLKALELTMEFTVRLRTVANNLRRVSRRTDAARLLAEYVQYARDLELVSDSAPVGLTEWLRARTEGI